MNLFADENVARDIVRWLRASGHDVLYAAEAVPGTPDADWLAKAEQEKRIVLTADKDFGELVFRDGLNSQGIVLLRLDDATAAEEISRLQCVWGVVEANPSGRFIVITQKKTRVRHLPPSLAFGLIANRGYSLIATYPKRQRRRQRVTSLALRVSVPITCGLRNSHEFRYRSNSSSAAKWGRWRYSSL